MRTTLPSRTAGLIAAMVFATVNVLLAGAVPRSPQASKSKPPDGAALYVAYCASCHGRSGRGDGPVADYLKIPPADLTKLAGGAKGAFSASEVGRIIDGRHVVRAHGDSAMPIWGDAFKPISPGIEEAEVRARIDALVKYLETMQPRQASSRGGVTPAAR